MVMLLSDILDSGQPADLLAFLLVAPLRSFSAKELAARLHTTTARAQSAIRVLERNNFVKSFTRNQAKFYLLNVRHPQVASLREQCLAEQGPWPDELFSSLKKLGQLSGIFLSGVFVGRPELPVDMLLIGKVSLSKLDSFLTATYKLTSHELNYSIMTREEFEIRRDTFDRFIKDIFDYPHVIVMDRPTQPADTNTVKRTTKKPAKKAAKKKRQEAVRKAVAKPAKKKVTKTKKRVVKTAKKHR